MRCKAKCKSTQQQCQRMAMAGKAVCYVHGGKSLSGIASPSYKHGRTSKYLPARLHEKFDEAYHDPNWRSLRQEIAVTRTRIKELMEKIDQGDASTLWQQLAAARALARSIGVSHTTVIRVRRGLTYKGE